MLWCFSRCLRAASFAASIPLAASCASPGSAGSAEASNARNCDIPADSSTAPVYFEFQIETQPTLQQQPSLRDRGIRGDAFAQYIIGLRGTPEVASIKIMKADSAAVGDSIRAIIPALRYKPGQIHGCPVRVLVQRPFEFR